VRRLLREHPRRVAVVACAAAGLFAVPFGVALTVGIGPAVVIAGLLLLAASVLIDRGA
jgi:hypothetical protein